MANLIPPDAKKAVIVEYWLRVVTVWLFLVGFGLIVVLLLKLPTYVGLRTAIGAYMGASARAESSAEISRESQETIREANRLIAVLKDKDQDTKLSQLINILDNIAGTGVELKSFSFQKANGNVTAISVSGVATTRQALVGFSNDVEEHPFFEDVDLPISNLAKDKNISFTTTITPTEE